MFKILATRKRRTIAVIFVAMLAAVLLGGAEYLARWQSSQVALYNIGLRLYQAGDHPCEEAELADPIGNKCIDIDTGIKAFHASIQAFIEASEDTSFKQRYLLPKPSREIASWAAMHEGILLIMKQKPEDAIKMLKNAITLADVPHPLAGMSEEQKRQALQNPSQELIDAMMEWSVLHADGGPLKKSVYNLELLFKKNPSQAQKEGKGEGKQKGEPKEPGDPDKDPSNQAGKGNRDKI